uniref:Glycerol dehydrogenase n=1 Tax=Paulinella longichromatophora TaxID=1708747 RepID=A0A2H4ZNW9_9EUKA|nr:hypothetical protein PLO_205 [Paulinella longichromatophora]
MNNIHKHENVVLQSHFGIVLGVLSLGCILSAIGIVSHYILWMALPVLIFGVFLGLQGILLRLEFTPYSFDIYRNSKLLRRFPYQNWLHWRLLWPRLPILLYFREKRSIHFLPVIFRIKRLRQELDERLIYEDSHDEV